MDKKDVATLLESLCNRPLAGDKAESYPELQAFYCAAVQALEQTENSQFAPGSDSIVGSDKITAAIASIVSEMDPEAARRVFEEAALRSTSVRLDALSALAFVDGIEQSPQVAPAHLVEQILAFDGTALARPTAKRHSAGGIWSQVVSGNWSVPRWRMAAVCAVLLTASGLTLSIYWQISNLTPGDSLSLPVEKTSIEQTSISNVPAEPRSTSATGQPCDPHDLKRAAPPEKIAQGEQPNPPATSASDQGCDASSSRQLADRPTEATGKASATQADRGVYQGPAHADRAGRLNGASGRNLPATAQSVRTFPPAAAPATSPSAVGRPQ